MGVLVTEDSGEAPRPSGRGVGADWDAAYRQSYQRLVASGFYLTGSLETAEDIVHDTFLRCRDRLDAVDNADQYLHRAVANGCYSWHRQQRRRERLEAWPPFTSSDIGPFVEFYDVLRELPERQRTAIVLRFHADLSDDDIAQILKCTPSTVRTLVQRGLTRLRQVIPHD